MPQPPATNQATYLYRCTEDKLEDHLQRIGEAGDSVEHAIYKGGRDYVLVVRRAGAEQTATVRLDDSTIDRLAKAIAAEQGRSYTGRRSSVSGVS